MPEWNPKLSDNDNVRNEDLSKRIAERLRNTAGGGGDDTCGCSGSLVSIQSGLLQEVTGINWLRRIIEKVRQAKPEWSFCARCSCKMCGVFREEPNGYKICITDFTYSSGFEWVAQLSVGTHIRIVIAEGDIAILRYHPKQADICSKTFNYIDNRELALGREWIVSLTQTIRAELARTAQEEAQVRKREEQELANEVQRKVQSLLGGK